MRMEFWTFSFILFIFSIMYINIIFSVYFSIIFSAYFHGSTFSDLAEHCASKVFIKLSTSVTNKELLPLLVRDLKNSFLLFNNFLNFIITRDVLF